MRADPAGAAGAGWALPAPTPCSSDPPGLWGPALKERLAEWGLQTPGHGRAVAPPWELMGLSPVSKGGWLFPPGLPQGCPGAPASSPLCEHWLPASPFPLPQGALTEASFPVELPLPAFPVAEAPVPGTHCCSRAVTGVPSPLSQPPAWRAGLSLFSTRSKGSWC